MLALRTFALLSITAFLAVVSALAAVIEVDPADDPLLLANLPLVGAGAANDAATEIIGSQAGVKNGAIVLTGEQETVTRALSLRAYRFAPLDPAALRNLAMLEESAGNSPTASDLVRLARSLSRRDRVSNGLLLRERALAGDVEGVLHALDQTLRASTRAREELMPTLMQYLQDGESVPVLSALLRQEPPWSEAFWYAVPRYPQSLVNAAQVRIALHHAGISLDPARDRSLLSELTRLRQYASARTLVAALTTGANRGANRVLDGDFEQVEGMAPFDWELFFDSSFSAEIDRSKGQLRLTMFGKAQGLAARQLIELEGAGPFQLAVTMADWRRDHQGLAYIRIGCAETGNSGESVRIHIEAAEFTQSFSKPSGDCVFHWLELHLAASKSRFEKTMLFDSVSIISADVS